MNRINILDDNTVNKIKAGEVVERPSSVIKELIENSIDANATKITIEINEGGKKLIRITDNGVGILSSEVEKSFLRHATSKISKVDDLYNLYSLGFRGEALASISSVSRLEMITKTKDELVGTKVIVEGGKIIKKEPVGCVNGTTIIIRDLFFNTPVRQKFLKSSHAEAVNISDLINKLAIGNPQIHFSYINNNKTSLTTPGDSKLINVIRVIYGMEICQNLIPVNYESKFFKIDGYIGNNNIYRANRNLQHLYINNRFVKSKILLDAISESYKSIIPINKHGVCFLNINLNPSQVDVNIHPTKLEIKLENDKEIYNELRNFIRKTLVTSNLIGKYETYEKIETQKPIEFQKTVTKQDRVEDVDIKVEKIEDLSINDFKVLDFEEISTQKTQEDKIKEGFEIYIDELEDIKLDFTNEQEIFFEKDINHKQRVSFSNYKIEGSIFNTYIILSNNDAMYLLDQHAAHEKVLYEKYMQKFYKKEINMQLLLDPIVVEVSNVDMLEIENNVDIFLKFGFDIEIFGNNHIMIRSVPTMFGNPESEKFILEIIDNINDIKNNYELKEDKFASMACRAAIKANDKIVNIEMKSLLNQLEICENPFTCPHGRPTIVEITKHEIEKMFKRIM